MKTFSTLEVIKVGFFISLIFGIYVVFLYLDDFIIVWSAILPLLLTNLLLLALKADCLDNPVIFNIKVSNIAILLKS